MRTKIDDLRGPEIAALLDAHMAGMRARLPACSVHALDLDGLRQSEISYWSAWDGTAQILARTITVAQERGYQRLSLETCSTPDFAAAHALYAGFGFTQCEPFAAYGVDPLSVFMTKVLATGRGCKVRVQIRARKNSAKTHTYP
jgi:putative acetyltransferase